MSRRPWWVEVYTNRTTYVATVLVYGGALQDAIARALEHAAETSGLPLSELRAGTVTSSG